MPTGDTALIYPGTCLFEGTLLSEGRGTCRPFEMVGAPGIDWHWAETLNTMNLPGVEFRENYYVPTFNKFVNQTCGGVQVHLTDPRRIDAIRTAVAMMVTAKKLYPSIFGCAAVGQGQSERQLTTRADRPGVRAGAARQRQHPCAGRADRAARIRQSRT